MRYRREAMRRWRRTWRARVGQAAGVVQAGVVRSAGANGVRGTLWVQKERQLVMHEQCFNESCNECCNIKETCDIEENLRYRGKLAISQT